MIKRTLLLFFALFTIGLVVSSAGTASAFNPFVIKDNSGSDSLCETAEQKQSAVCKERSKNGDPITGSGGLLIDIVNIISFVAGAAAVIVIVVSGIKFIISRGEPGNVTTARNTLINALIGLAVILLGRALIIFVITRVG